MPMCYATEHTYKTGTIFRAMSPPSIHDDNQICRQQAGLLHLHIILEIDDKLKSYREPFYIAQVINQDQNLS